MATLCTLLVFSTCLQIVNAFQPFTNTSIPASASPQCGQALSTDLACNPIVFSFQPGNYYNASLLEAACTSDCNSALESWQVEIDTACAGTSWVGSYNETSAVQSVPDLVRYNFNQTCRTNAGNYCNVVLGQAASSGSANSTANACGVCAIQALQFAAGSPYYDGPLLRSKSVYQSYTSSCQVTGYPLTTTTLGFTLPPTTSTTTSTSAPTCTGSTYQIGLGDDCHSISLSQGIGTMWLLTDNDLPAYCSDFPTSGTLCLEDKCSVYTVQQNDTCDTIAASYNSSVTQLLAWNPVINAGCNNLNNSVGSQICIDEPGVKYIPPTTSLVAATTASTPAAVPTDVAAGTNTNCGEYYMAVPGDYCNLVVLKFGISLSDFLFLNSAINENCTNLYAEESYCVEAVGDIQTYPGMPGYASATATDSTIPFSSFPTATYVPITTNSTGLPLAPGTRTDCNIYIDGSDYQFNTTGSGNFSECDTVAAFWGITATDLGVWNPSLNSSTTTCTLSPNYSYCAILVAAPSPTIIAPTEVPIRPGASANCTFYYDVEPGTTCQTLLDATCLTIAQLFEYNPAVNADCSGLWLGYQYCVRTPDYVDQVCNGGSITTTTSSGSPTTTSGAAIPSPTQPNSIISTCNKYAQAPNGDWCDDFANKNGITDAQLYAWNSVLGSDGSNCGTEFFSGYYYCVGVSSTSPTTTSSKPTTTKPSVAVPSPTQPNSIISSCSKYAQAPDGDWCDDFATKNSITDAQLYAWNSVLGSDGSNCGTEFFSGYYYCVAVSS